MEISNNHFISFVVSGRLDDYDKEHIDEIETTKFGFYWWYWKPMFMFNPKTVEVFSFRWLCFLVDYTNFNNLSIKDFNGKY
ncbi:MAG: hypothetical protein DRG33_07815 [Deltaproteobacteria bacterium]|nr:MAG: hypothetical protein DRG33_07815 [Deltaproteobacteria bacterium]